MCVRLLRLADSWQQQLHTVAELRMIQFVITGDPVLAKLDKHVFKNKLFKCGKLQIFGCQPPHKPKVSSPPLLCFSLLYIQFKLSYKMQILES